MNTVLSLSSETVAKAHINGLRHPQGVDLHLAAEEVTGLEKFPVERALKILQSALQEGGITGQLAQNIQQARMQAASRMREVSEAAHRIPFLVSRMAQDIQQSRVQAASRMSHLAETANRVPFWGSNVARDMQQVRIQAASGISQFATSTHLAQMRMNQMTQMVQEAQIPWIRLRLSRRVSKMWGRKMAGNKLALQLRLRPNQNRIRTHSSEIRFTSRIVLEKVKIEYRNLLKEKI